MKKNRFLNRARLRPLVTSLLAVGCVHAAWGFQIETEDPDLKIHWDNTFKYSTGVRLKSPDVNMVGGANANFDDGDLNFKKHSLISNRVDWLSEFDLSKKGVGLRMSTAAWYDQVYNTHTDNPGTSYTNSLSGDGSRFTDGTRDLHGRKAEFMDAFVFGNFSLANMATSVRLGQHLVVYGESFFGGGISDAQGPVDVAKVLSVPGLQVKEFLMPVPQVSTNVQINPEWTWGAYYQFKWRASRLPGVGSYYSFVDVGVPTAETINLGTAVLARGEDIKPKDSGQWGTQLRYKPTGADWEYGLYAARFHDKAPSAFILDFSKGTLRNVYNEGTTLVGASVSRSFDSLNVAAEASVRHNQSLNAGPLLYFGSGNLSPATGKTAHVQANALYLLPPSALADGGVVIAEMAWQRLLSVTNNPTQLVNPMTGATASLFDATDGKTRDATKLTLMVSPSYFQVMPGLDLEVPMVLSWGVAGRSSIDSGAVGWRRGVGSLSLGLGGTYQQVWKFGVNYTTYLGSTGTIGTYGQLWKDRDNISLNVRRTF